MTSEGFFVEPLVFQRETVSADAATATTELATLLQQLQSSCGKRITTLPGLDGVSVLDSGEVYWQHGPVVIDLTALDVPAAQFEQLVRDLEARFPSEVQRLRAHPGAVRWRRLVMPLGSGRQDSGAMSVTVGK